jgi:hypothetical protein
LRDLKARHDRRKGPVVPKSGVTILSRLRQSTSQIEASLSGDDQWYVSRNEQEYGPLHFGDLAKFARQGRLLERDWVWKPGLASWIAAGEVSGIFAKPPQARNEPRQINRSDGEPGDKPQSKQNFKEKAKDQIKNFALMFLYLWVVFGMLAIHESIILSQHRIGYVSHGLAVVNALVFAKVMLVAEDLHLGHRLDDKPLIYSILFKSLLFGVTLICFHILEHLLIGMWHGEPMAESIAQIGVNQLGGAVSLGIVATVALVPFFILREISRVIGAENFWALFFRPRRS